MLIRARDCLQGVPIDVYLPARVAPGSDPVEFFKPFDGLRREGLFSALGASEVSASTLRALEEAGIPISVIEIEVSLWCFDDKVKDVIAYSDESKIPVYAYSPLGRGFLTRTWKTPEDIPAGSMQAHLPRFQGENFYHNIKLVDVLDDLAVAKGLTTAQLAIAWVCNLGRYVSDLVRLTTDYPYPWLVQPRTREAERRGCEYPPHRRGLAADWRCSGKVRPQGRALSCWGRSNSHGVEMGLGWSITRSTQFNVMMHATHTSAQLDISPFLFRLPIMSISLFASAVRRSPFPTSVCTFCHISFSTPSRVASRRALLLPVGMTGGGLEKSIERSPKNLVSLRLRRHAACCTWPEGIDDSEEEDTERNPNRQAVGDGLDDTVVDTSHGRMVSSSSTIEAKRS